MTLQEDLDKMIEQTAKSAGESVAAYGKLAEDANAQLNGASSADAGAWLKLAARAYAQAAGDTARALTTGLGVLERVAEDASSGDDADPNG